MELFHRTVIERQVCGAEVGVRKVFAVEFLSCKIVVGSFGSQFFIFILRAVKSVSKACFDKSSVCWVSLLGMASSGLGQAELGVRKAGSTS